MCFGKIQVSVEREYGWTISTFLHSGVLNILTMSKTPYRFWILMRTEQTDSSGHNVGKAFDWMNYGVE